MRPEWSLGEAGSRWAAGRVQAHCKRKRGLEAPSGVEPLHRSFADCSLNHLGTAPSAHYSEPCSYISTYTLKGMTKKRGQVRDYRLGSTGISFPRVAG